jgi:hypothetical protein
LSTDAPEPGSDLVALAPDTSPAVVKRQLAATRATAVRKREQLEAARDELRRAVDGQLGPARRALEGLTAQVKRLEEGIYSVNLYLGRDEEIITLRTGRPAPDGTAITIRQLVLAMDEEIAVAGDVAARGGIDARSIEKFDEWLLADPQNLAQVLPEVKGVVVLRPRRARADYRDPWVQQAMDEANATSYWLIRNGDQLFRMTTDLNVGKRLVPVTSEFTDLFTEKRYNFATQQDESVHLQPGSSSWLRAQNTADARRRHYMRVALVLQGLLDRTTVLAPLPAPGVSVLEPTSYAAGWINLVTDDENAIGTGMPAFSAWLTERNKNLRPGMRIVGAFNGSSFRDLRPERRYDMHPRIHPQSASWPQTGELYQLKATRADAGFTFSYDRTDNVWDGADYRPAKTKASCAVYPDDTFILPFDLVTADELRYYLTARTQRHAYLEMVPLMKAAITAKEAEQEAEAPFRLMLAGEISRAHGVAVDEAETKIQTLVDWWKLTNRWHRPLVSDDQADLAKAVRMIVAEFGAHRAAADQATSDAGRETQMCEQLRAQFSAAVAVFRKRDGAYVVFERADDRPVHVHRHTVSSTGRSRRTDEWVLPGFGHARWRTLWSHDVWAKWDLPATAAQHLTGPEEQQLVEQTRRHAVGKYGPIAAITHEAKDRRLVMWQVPLAPITEPVPALTGKFATMSAYRTSLRWRRTTGGRLETDISGTWGQTWDWHVRSWPGHRRAPWGGTVTDGAWSPQPAGRDRERIVWSDPAVISQAVLLHEQGSQISAMRVRLADESTRIRLAIEAAWVHARRQEAYVRFLEDYEDESLWEGHSKTLNLHCPHRGHEGLSTLTARLAETGTFESGTTVKLLLTRVGLDATAVPADLVDLTVIVE